MNAMMANPALLSQLYQQLMVSNQYNPYSYHSNPYDLGKTTVQPSVFSDDMLGDSKFRNVMTSPVLTA